MARMGAGVPCIAWLNPEQTDMAGNLARLAGLSVVGAGSPARGKAGSVASALGATSHDDLRSVLTSAECEVVLLLASGDFGADPSGADTGALAAAKARGVRVISIEPVPGSASELAAGRWTKPRVGVTPLDCVRFVPVWTMSKPFRHATEVLAAFGPARTLNLVWTAPPALASLGARLLGAMMTMHSVMGEPETVDAAYAWPSRAPGLHALPSESLRDLTGDLTANLRFSDGRGASMLVSDQGGAWNRSLTLLGGRGSLEIDDRGFRWIGMEGATIDSWESAPTNGVALLADAIAGALEGQPEGPPGDIEGSLAMAQAALLSVRTGQAESPGMIRRIFAGVS
jgi:hypothetical protein